MTRAEHKILTAPTVPTETKRAIARQVARDRQAKTVLPCELQHAKSPTAKLLAGRISKLTSRLNVVKLTKC